MTDCTCHPPGKCKAAWGTLADWQTSEPLCLGFALRLAREKVHTVERGAVVILCEDFGINAGKHFLYQILK